ncbi:MAG TPA: dioxygenase [Gammaproteobacteria bacterium]|nr:dioxygenase [Gammaproteobacteria bacterium]
MNFTDKVLKAYAAIENPRSKELIQNLIKHLHAYVKETNLSTSEWEFTWDYLAQMAKFTHDDGNEFLLLADVLGVSQLIELINHQRPENTAGFALVGPFYRANAPLRKRGESIASADTQGERVIIKGHVIDIENNQPIPNAVLDTWQGATNGLYESQDPNQSDMNLRGKFETDKNGTYELIALMPTPYPVPTDGPVGELLRMAKRHPNRPAHIHFVVSAPGYETFVTQVFVEGDELVGTDAVFTASENMIGEFKKEKDHYTLQYNFQLKKGKSVLPKAPIQ